jgi:hypothetical protein
MQTDQARGKHLNRQRWWGRQIYQRLTEYLQMWSRNWRYDSESKSRLNLGFFDSNQPTDARCPWAERNKTMNYELEFCTQNQQNPLPIGECMTRPRYWGSNIVGVVGGGTRCSLVTQAESRATMAAMSFKSSLILPPVLSSGIDVQREWMERQDEITAFSGKRPAEQAPGVRTTDDQVQNLFCKCWPDKTGFHTSQCHCCSHSESEHWYCPPWPSCFTSALTLPWCVIGPLSTVTEHKCADPRGEERAQLVPYFFWQSATQCNATRLTQLVS